MTRFFKYFGKAPTTSARPPTLTKGKHSDATIRIFIFECISQAELLYYKNQTYLVSYQIVDTKFILKTFFRFFLFNSFIERS